MVADTTVTMRKAAGCETSTAWRLATTKKGYKLMTELQVIGMFLMIYGATGVSHMDEAKFFIGGIVFMVVGFCFAIAGVPQ